MAAIAWLASLAPALAGEWSGYLAVELREFPNSPAAPRQFDGENWSLVAEPEYYHEWDDGRQSFAFRPFQRLDQHDSKRTHFDIRELIWLKAADTWELRLGVGKVFWGVAEAVHLVDIINQTDLVENIDGEDKLGQPMVNLALIRDWGTVDLFMLPGFRERTFPEKKGRLRTIPRVETAETDYDSSAEQYHVDWAVRWSHTLGDWDIGLAHFYGTSREPRLFPKLRKGGEVVLAPFYDLINQSSIDLQATLGQWLWKLEAFTRSGQGQRFSALAAGFEYTLVGAFDTRMDLGVLGEYLYDDRPENVPTLFQKDIFAGLRLTLNDPQSTEVLVGVVHDLDDSSRVFNLEASRRLGERWKLSVEGRAFANVDPSNPVLFSLRRDDYIQIELARYF